ncbi:MAG TPA: hypothetical protein VLA19_25210 [Herpetosiphonaceae bacterium]|nr:hypothetical protein [Herpetosiphonaceae bacterium]
MAVTVQSLPLRHARERRAEFPSYFRLGDVGLLAGAVIAVCILSILYLAQTGRVATRGYRLQELQDRHAMLQREAEQLEYRIAAANRLDSIEERAMKIGLRGAAPTQLRYVTVEMAAGPVVAQR